MPDDSAFLLDPVPHDEAAKWISSKPVVSREVFDSLLPELKARAFLITGIEDANTAGEIRDIIAQLPQGESWDSVKKQVVEKLGPWFEKDAANARAELLIRTHGFQSYAVAQHAVMERQADVFPFWQYLSLGDEKVRPAHAALNERIVPGNDPFWRDHNPPWQWGCRCRKVPLLPEEVDEIKDEDKKRLPEDRRVLEGPALDKARNGQLDAGPAKQVDIRSDRMRGKPDGYHFDPSGLTIPLAQLKERYDPATWAEFETTAKAQEIQPGLTVWAWLNGNKPKVQKVRKNKGTPATPPPPAQPTKAAAPSQPATKPAGTPLKGKLDSSKITKTEQQRVNNVLAIIDRLHGDGPLKPIPIGNKPGKGTLGYFWGRTGIPAKEIMYKKPGKNPSPFLHPELTIAHEVGHWLDHGGKGKNAFATDVLTGELADWWQSVQNSASFKSLQTLRDSRKMLYYTSPTEAWARSYAQFIAEESGDPTLLQQVKDIRAEPLPERQWEEADFAPIRQEMRNVFIKWGWMAPQQNPTP